VEVSRRRRAAAPRTTRSCPGRAAQGRGRAGSPGTAAAPCRRRRPHRPRALGGWRGGAAGRGPARPQPRRPRGPLPPARPPTVALAAVRSVPRAREGRGLAAAAAHGGRERPAAAARPLPLRAPLRPARLQRRGAQEHGRGRGGARHGFVPAPTCLSDAGSPAARRWLRGPGSLRPPPQASPAPGRGRRARGAGCREGGVPDRGRGALCGVSRCVVVKRLPAIPGGAPFGAGARTEARGRRDRLSIRTAGLLAPPARADKRVEDGGLLPRR
jgi:hypothetical protein